VEYFYSLYNVPETVDCGAIIWYLVCGGEWVGALLFIALFFGPFSFGGVGVDRVLKWSILYKWIHFGLIQCGMFYPAL
jgi:hypothetical protein